MAGAAQVTLSPSPASLGWPAVRMRGLCPEVVLSPSLVVGGLLFFLNNYDNFLQLNVNSSVDFKGIICSEVLTDHQRYPGQVVSSETTQYSLFNALLTCPSA